ncbi:phosphoglycolate phosphatase [Luteimonas dalianensis]|uniref:phosphoglycolate phosphatase n=1 Tax=Luteimonas dalianensis TaxID=1148196 RepID=UPI003BF12901
MPFPFSAVLFDLDGTLVDSASDIAEAVNRMLAEQGLGPADEALVRSWIGEGSRMLLETALEHFGSSASAEVLMERFMLHYGDCLLRSPRLYPGVAETLAELDRRGVSMAVCTNKPERFVAPMLEHMGIAGRFAGVVGAGTLPERKPHPRPLLHLAERMRVEPGRCLMVGDSQTDFLAGQAAGMPVVLVSYGYARGFDLRAAGALAVIDRFQDLLTLDM